MKPTESQLKAINELAKDMYPHHNRLHWDKKLMTAYKQGMTDYHEKLDVDNDKLRSIMMLWERKDLNTEEAKQQILQSLKIKQP